MVYVYVVIKKENGRGKKWSTGFCTINLVNLIVKSNLKFLCVFFFFVSLVINLSINHVYFVRHFGKMINSNCKLLGALYLDEYVDGWPTF